MRTNATVAEMVNALKIVNAKYAGNVCWNRFEPNGKSVHFTLKVSKSKGPGHSIGYMELKTGGHAKLSYACWHVHGDFFDALIEVNPKARIRTAKTVIDATGGNWQDWNVGSIVRPMYYSEKCDCGKGELCSNCGHPRESHGRDAAACRCFSLVPFHIKKREEAS